MLYNSFNQMPWRVVPNQSANSTRWTLSWDFLKIAKQVFTFILNWFCNFLGSSWVFDQGVTWSLFNTQEGALDSWRGCWFTDIFNSIKTSLEMFKGNNFPEAGDMKQRKSWPIRFTRWQIKAEWPDLPSNLRFIGRDITEPPPHVGTIEWTILSALQA